MVTLTKFLTVLLQEFAIITLGVCEQRKNSLYVVQLVTVVNSDTVVVNFCTCSCTLTSL